MMEAATQHGSRQLAAMRALADGEWHAVGPNEGALQIRVIQALRAQSKVEVDAWGRGKIPTKARLIHGGRESLEALLSRLTAQDSKPIVKRKSSELIAFWAEPQRRHLLLELTCGTSESTPVSKFRRMSSKQVENLRFVMKAGIDAQYCDNTMRRTDSQRDDLTPIFALLSIYPDGANSTPEQDLADFRIARINAYDAGAMRAELKRIRENL